MRSSVAAAVAILSCAAGVAGAATLLEPALAPAGVDLAPLPLLDDDGRSLVLVPATQAATLLPSVPLLPDDLVLVESPADARHEAPPTLLLRAAAVPARPHVAPLAAKAERLDDAAPGAVPAATAEPSFAFAPPAESAAAETRAFAPAVETGAPRAAAATGGALALAALLGFALYHRIRPHAALENETRKLIFDTVCTRPGLGVHTIAAAAGVSYSTATYHLERLVAAGMIVMTPDGNKLCYYKNGGAFTETERKILPLLKNDEASRLLDAILDSPGTYRAALAERLGVTATTVNWHLKRLREAGLVRETRQGRNAYLHVDAQAMRAAMAPLAQKIGASDPLVIERIRRYVTGHAGTASS